MTPHPTIRLQDDFFVLRLPSPTAGRTHEVHISIRHPDQLIRLLQARRDQQLRIAELGAPVQAQIDRPSREAELALINYHRAKVLEELGILQP